MYWQKVVPLLYRSGFGIFDFGKPIVAWLRWFTHRASDQPSYAYFCTPVCCFGSDDVYAQFECRGFDSCPSKADSARLKSLLGLGWGAQIAMVVAVGSVEKRHLWSPFSLAVGRSLQ